MATIRKSTEAMSSEAVEKGTGKPLAHWLKVLDDFDAKAKGHAAAARHLQESHGLGGWWAQSVTVAYEQERGLRKAGQRSDGKFAINVSKTIAVPHEKAFAAWSSAEAWNRWFTTGAKVDFREGGAYSNNDKDQGVITKILHRGQPNSYGEISRIEMTWDNAEHCPGTKVTVQFLVKSQDRTTVAIEHSKLASQDAAAEMKQGWSWAIASLKSWLETGAPIRHEDWLASQSAKA